MSSSVRVCLTWAAFVASLTLARGPDRRFVIDRSPMQAVAWVGLCGIIALSFGCPGTSKTERKVGMSDLPSASETEDGLGWQSAPFPTMDECAEGDGPRWLKLEAKSDSEGLVIDHPLGRRPELVMPYIAFFADGCGSTPGGGDTLVIDYVGDTTIKVHNNTEETSYLRLLLR